MTYAGTQLPGPVFGGNHLATQGYVITFVLEFAAIAPVLIQTGEESERLHGQQVVGLALEEVGGEVDAVVQQVGFQTHVETLGGLPLDGGVTDAGEREARYGVHEHLTLEVAAGSIVVDIIIAAHIITGRQTQIVHPLVAGEPVLVRQHPRGLYRGEDGPYGIQCLQPVGLFTETGRTVGGEVGLQEIATLVVVLSLGIHAQRSPGLTQTRGGSIQQRGTHEGGLVTTRVVTELGVVGIGLPLDAGTSEHMQTVGLVAVAPVKTGVAHHRVLLRSQRAHLVLTIGVNARHIIVGHTVDGDVVHLIGVDQIIAEVLHQREVAVDLILGTHAQVEHGVLKAVLVFTLSIFVESGGVTETVVIVLVLHRGEGLVEIALVDHVILRRRELATAIAVGAHEGALHIG